MPPRHNRTVDTAESRGQKAQALVNVAGPDPVMLADTNAKRKSLLFYNNSQQACYIGTHDVLVGGVMVPLTIANGVGLAAGGTFTEDDSYDQWWGITANGALSQIVVIEVTLDKN